MKLITKAIYSSPIQLASFLKLTYPRMLIDNENERKHKLYKKIFYIVSITTCLISMSELSYMFFIL